MLIERPRGEYNVLIVEDDSAIQAKLKRMFEGLGYTVSGTAASYNEAITSAQRTLPDLALCDIGLIGHRDGIEVAQKLKEMGNVAIIFVTVNNDNEVIARAMEVVPSNYLIKSEAAMNQNVLDIQAQIALKNLGTANLVAQDQEVWISSRGTAHKIKVDEILYVKADNNDCFIYTTQEVYDIRQRFGSVVSDLTEYGILQVNRSEALNINKVSQYDKGPSSIVLDYKGLSESMRQEELPRSFNVTVAHRETIAEELGDV
ncbi:hypothetical protein BKI52_11775 [marine bacterium AO1-C]|nr:hypothetical protein BKI52_11775 [marine bacterium AO1-C]